eukprot:scaffold1668_cov113-Isochrysis_galbana.AAC.2
MELGQSQAWTIWIPGNSRARFSCGCSRWRYSMSRRRVLRRISRSGSGRCGGGKDRAEEKKAAMRRALVALRGNAAVEKREYTSTWAPGNEMTEAGQELLGRPVMELLSPTNAFEIDSLIGKMVADGGDVPGRTRVPAGTVLYKVLWAGFRPEIATWEEEDDIPCGESEIDFIAEYEAGLEVEAEADRAAADEEADSDEEQDAG